MGIDALLNQALSFERIEVPSLTGFLVWMELMTFRSSVRWTVRVI